MDESPHVVSVTNVYDNQFLHPQYHPTQLNSVLHGNTQYQVTNAKMDVRHRTYWQMFHSRSSSGMGSFDRTRASLRCPLANAIENGVRPLSSCALTSAPCSINNRAMSRSPFREDRCNGVLWRDRRAFTFAPWSMSNCVMLRFPLSAAT